jgi:hypothetical protein
MRARRSSTTSAGGGRAQRLLPWLVRVTWLVLPFTAGPALSSALHHHSRPVVWVAGAELWAAWAVVVLGTLVPYPLGLTALRTLAPADVVVTTVAAATGRPSPIAATAGLATTALALVVAMTPETGRLFANGPAYPNARRFPLRVPGPLVLGPLEVAWALTVGLPAAGGLLLAARSWAAGAADLTVGVPLAVLLGRSLHGLSRRWLVFVPAGVVLHDPLSLADPVLLRTPLIETLWPAPANSDSLDLTQGAFGLALELVLREPVPVVLVKPGRRGAEGREATRLLFTPTRPGAVISYARSRRLPVG